MPPVSLHSIYLTIMVDKILYDWQQRSTINQYSYGGGSVTALPSFTIFVQFPTGLPPYLSVSAK